MGRMGDERNLVPHFYGVCMIYNIRMFFFLLKYYVKHFKREYLWRINTVKYYATRIKAHVTKYPDGPDKFRHWAKPPLPKDKYPYDPVKAKQVQDEIDELLYKSDEPR